MSTENKIENLSVVIPIHEIKEEDTKFFEDCIKSIKKQSYKPKNVTIVHTKSTDLDLVNKVLESEEFKDEVSLILNETDKTDFYSQVNYFTNSCETEWFSIIEFDDEYAKYAFDHFIEYREAYSGIKMFLPLVAETKTEGEFIKFTNEIGLVNSRDNLTSLETIRQLGFVDFDMVSNHVIYRPIGGFIKTEEFIDCGKFKPSIKYHQQYEFMLRWTHKENETMTMFKLGYQHKSGRENSHDMSPDFRPTAEEFYFWLDTAKKEYYFPREREIKTDFKIESNDVELKNDSDE